WRGSEQPGASHGPLFRAVPWAMVWLRRPIVGGPFSWLKWWSYRWGYGCPQPARGVSRGAKRPPGEPRQRPCFVSRPLDMKKRNRVDAQGREKTPPDRKVPLRVSEVERLRFPSRCPSRFPFRFPVEVPFRDPGGLPSRCLNAGLVIRLRHELVREENL